MRHNNTETLVPPTEYGATTGPALGRCLSSLDALETSVDALPHQTAAQYRIHARHEEERNRTLRAFAGSGVVGLEKRAAKLGDCCRWPKLAKCKAGKPLILHGYCRDRMCPTCADRRSMRVFARTKEALGKAASVRFLTLTLAESTRELGEQLDHLTDSFRRLRQSKLWKTSVKGGVATIEVTRGQRGEHWHVHMHILITGEYISQTTLASQWELATTDSKIVHIRACHNRDKDIGYAAKYAAKPANTTNWTEAELCVFAEQVKGKRLIIAFGDCHASKIEKNNEREQPEIDEEICSFQTITQQAEQGNEDAKYVHAVLARSGPRFRACLGLPPLPHRADQALLVTEQETAKALDLAKNLARDDTAPPVDREPGEQHETQRPEQLSLPLKISAPPVRYR